MNRTQEFSSRGQRTLGLTLVLGAVLGALGGAGFGALRGEPGAWAGWGIPIGISIALAVGSFLSKPAGVASPTSWMMEDDAVPIETPARAQDKPQPQRSTNEAA